MTIGSAKQACDPPNGVRGSVRHRYPGSSSRVAGCLVGDSNPAGFATAHVMVGREDAPEPALAAIEAVVREAVGRTLEPPTPLQLTPVRAALREARGLPRRGHRRGPGESRRAVLNRRCRDDFNYPITVHVYANDGNGNHFYIGQTTAGGWWNEGVAGACGGNPWHGYSFRIPDSVRNGIGYLAYEYAINICGSACEQGNPLLNGSGALFGYGTPAGWSDSSFPNGYSGYSDSSYFGNNASTCGNGWTYKYGKTITRSKSYGLWNRKLHLYVIWCANSAKTRITGFTTTVWTDHGGWCGNSSEPSVTKVDGGVGASYVEFQAVAYVNCASLPFNWPRLNDTLWFRTRFKADRSYVTVAHD